VRAELPDHHGEETEAILASLGSVVATLRARWPGVRVRLRADAGFADPELYDWLEKNDVAYAIGIAANPVLQRLAQPWCARAQKAASASPTGSACLYGTVWYQAGSWEKKRRVVVKVTVTPAGQKVRFLVCFGLGGAPRAQYRFYGGRGDSENRIKELKEGVRSDRLSCCEFESNKVRLMLASVAYVLLQGLRRLARGTEWAAAQVERLRLGVIKIGARVVESQRRVVVELCSSYPWQAGWRRLAEAVGIGRE
jgi:Transposase DDE domain group 1